MAEWLILLLLVPAIVAPIVLVFAFAGCGFQAGVTPEPTIDSATGTSFNTISVAWGINGSASVTFQRTNLNSTVTDLGVQSANPFTDTVPAPSDSPSLVYQYQADNALDSPPVWSTAVSGKTFELTFDGMLNPTIEGTGAEGRTQVQRIEPAYPLTKSSTQVQILLQADAVSGASIDAIYISQGLNPPSEAWQPAADLTQVPLPAQPFIIPPGGSVVALAPVAYTLDNSKPLLIAVDYSASPASGVKASNPLPITLASVYYGPGAEAGLQTRSAAGYNLITTDGPTYSAINLIANIYVFVG
jgi:hypothetical protein